MAADNTVTSNSIALPLSNMFAVNGKVLVFADGSKKLIRERSTYIASEPDDYYTVKYGDMITNIAYKFYKDKVDKPSHYYWIIADANKIKNPLDLTSFIGKEIVIPNILNFKLSN